MRLGLFIAPVHPMGENPTLQIRRDLELVDHADRLGFAEAWYGEHHSGGLEIIACPELMIAAAAERTKHIRLGTGVCTLPYHNPFLIADRIVQLDHQTMGRVIFGAGAGALAYDAHMIGVDHDAIRGRVEQSLSVITRLFAGESVTEKTDWYDLRDARLQLLPYQSSIELALTAVNTAAGPRTAGQFGAGLLSIAATTSKGFDALPSTWEICSAAAAAAGKPVSRDSWRLVGPVHIAETREAARRDVRFGLQEWLNYFTKVGTLPLAGGVSGMLKNALDYTEDLREDVRPYFEGRAVGCIVSAAGWQGVGTTLVALRSIVHALRGWPTPLGVGINSKTNPFGPGGECLDEGLRTQLELLGEQVAQFAVDKAHIRAQRADNLALAPSGAA